jgi:D-lactate dehydrogenase (cytochrome)
MKEIYSEYLSDESKLKGNAVSISFPKTSNDVLQVIEHCKNGNLSITIQGGRSGIVGSCVPNNNHIMSTENLNNISRIDDETLMVQCGVNLNDLSIYLEKECRGYFFPVDPTEKTATIGGIIASGSKGPNSYYYGCPSNYIKKMKVVLSDLSVKELTSEDDLFHKMFSSEGMFAFILEASIQLVKKPEHIWGITFFFKEVDDVCGFSQEVKTYESNSTAKIVCGEFMDNKTIELINEYKDNMSKIKAISPIPQGYKHLIYIELHSDEEDDLDELIEYLMTVAMTHNSDVEIAWAVSEESDLENMRNYRHAGAECVNIAIEKMKNKIPGIIKNGLDIKTDENLYQIMERYMDINIDNVIFGHIFSSHLHLNFIPKNEMEYLQAKELNKELSLSAKEKGGCIITEHGVGKLKKNIFSLVAEEGEISNILRIKQDLDSENLFDPNNIV